MNCMFGLLHQKYFSYFGVIEYSLEIIANNICLRILFKFIEKMEIFYKQFFYNNKIFEYFVST